MFVQKPSNSKITEKLKILNEKVESVLIEIDFLKNTLLTDDGALNKILTDSNYESDTKLLLKKFPNIDIKTNKSNLEHLSGIREKIIDELYFHYNCLIDVMDIKDNLMDLFGQISAFQFPMNIDLNFDMTVSYLELIANYSAMMIILSGIIPQIKSILVLYNFAVLSKFDQDDRFYHRLCERLVEKQKDGAINEIHNELNPYSKTITNALNSLNDIVKAKQLPPTGWERNQSFELVVGQEKPSNLLTMNRSMLVPYCQIERWIVFGCLSVYSEILKSATLSQLWRTALTYSFSLLLWRAEHLQLHALLQKFFDKQKGYGKLANGVKEAAREFNAQSISLHRSRRTYLRLQMRRQWQQIIDFPGSMGPNAVVVLHTLTNAVDEIDWFVRHSDLVTSAGSQSKQTFAVKLDDFIDQLLPEFLFYVEEIRYLLQQYFVVDRYYRLVLNDIDLPELDRYRVQLANRLTEEESEILESFSEKIANIDNSENKDEMFVDFSDIRMDWFRLQTFLSYSNSSFSWADQTRFIIFVNSMMIHLELVDNLSEVIDRCSSMKFLYFHRQKLSDWFDMNMKVAAQHRFAIVFSRIAAHFIRNCQPDACPEDYNAILRSSTDMAHCFLSRICQELSKTLTSMVKSHFELNLKLQANNAVDLYNYSSGSQRKGKGGVQDGTINKAAQAALSSLPGTESKKKNITVSNEYDMELMALNQLASGLNTRPVSINNRFLSPCMYLKKELCKFLTDKFISLSSVRIKREKGDSMTGTRRPSEMLLIIKECMSLISRINDFVNIDVARLFIDAFLRQSLSKDIMGYTTLTETYCNWYVDYILCQPHILHTPLLKCFVTIVPQNQKEAAAISINVEEYTDIEELRALVEVIGPFGMKSLSEKIMQLIVKNVSALRKFVQRNRSTLMELNVLNLDYGKIKRALTNMEDVDEFCQQWKQMGILFAFKDMCREALQDIVRKSMPFLKSTVEDLQQDFDSDPSDRMSSVSEHDNQLVSHCKTQLEINELCQGFGLKTKVDSNLFIAIESIKQQQLQLQTTQTGNIDQTEDQINDLLMVATSYLLPRLVGSNFYHVEYEALDQSAHCAAYAIKELMYAFFFKYGEDRLNDQVRKFIALTSSNLLRLGMETSGSSNINKDETVLINNRDSIYIFFDFVIQTLENISDDFYEECFPYALVRQAYHNLVKQSRLVMTKAAHPTEASSKAAIDACKFDK